MSTYPDSVQYLYSLGNEVKSLKFGLEGITSLVNALGSPHRRFRSVHIAGTNGKGSTCAMIDSGLRAAGFRTGLYTSPHLVEPTERIQIAGTPVTREQFTDAFVEVHETAEQLLRNNGIETHPTYFETVTAMAFILFSKANVDFAVLEVGMGGRLDATNVVTPELAVITPIDFDHEQWLGNTIEKIAGEKAGILKSHVPAVFAKQRPEAQAVLEARAAELGCPVTRAEHFDATKIGVTIRCPLPGAHQLENAVTAVAALHQLGVNSEAIERGIAATRWPGRLELVHRAPDILLDGAHNPAGARALAQYLAQLHAGRRITLIYGVMRDKSVQEMTEILFPLADNVVLTAPASSRAMQPRALEAVADHPAIVIVSSVREALLSVKQSVKPTDLIVVAGSLHLVGEFRALLVQ